MKQIAVWVMLLFVICLLANGANGQEKKKSTSLSNEDFPNANESSKSASSTNADLSGAKELEKIPKGIPAPNEADLDILIRSANPISAQDLKARRMRGLILHFQYYDLLLGSEKAKSSDNYGPRMARLQNQILQAPYENVTDQDLVDLAFRDRFVTLRFLYNARFGILARAQEDLEAARKAKNQTSITDAEERVKQIEQSFKRLEAQFADLRREGRERGASDRAFKLVEEK